MDFDHKLNLVDALAFCGTKSVRDHDKFEGCGLNILDSKKVKSPAIGNGTYENWGIF